MEGLGNRQADAPAKRRRLGRLGATVVIASMLAGCTSFSGQRFDLSTGDKPHGLYVFDEVPLLVITNGQPSILMVKSANRGTAIQFSAFLAKHDVSLEFFATGGLSKVTSNQDATALPLALVTLAKAAVDKLPTGLGLSGKDGAATTFQVYKIVFVNGEISSLEPLLATEARRLMIEVPAPPAASGTPLGEVDKPATPPCDPKKPPKGKTCPDITAAQ